MWGCRCTGGHTYGEDELLRCNVSRREPLSVRQRALPLTIDFAIVNSRQANRLTQMTIQVHPCLVLDRHRPRVPIAPRTVALMLLTVSSYDVAHGHLQRLVIIFCSQRYETSPLSEQLLSNVLIYLKTLDDGHSQTAKHCCNQPTS